MMKLLKLIIVAVVATLLSFIAVNQLSFAAEIKACKKLKQSSELNSQDLKPKKVFCSVKPAVGRAGDLVEIKNKYNYIVATGKVVRRGRTSTVILLTGYRKNLGSMTGYPVLLRNDESQDFWTATTAPF